MAEGPIRRVAILGGGPAGAALATWLAREGFEPVVFARAKRPPIVVGESLVPAIVPFLRKLGVEEEVRDFSTYKGGATFGLGETEEMSFKFYEVRGARTTYSYNVPRDRFDATLLDAARRAGARVVEQSAGVEREGDSERLRLDAASLEAAGDALGGAQPDFVVDATGRSRHVARLLDLPTVEGNRRDTALHAHLTGVPVRDHGSVHTERLHRGWSWRIPLPDRVSLGFVVDGEYLRKFGDRPDEQFDRFLRFDPRTRPWADRTERLTPVLRYTNYQLRATRGVGPNWALLGDSFGFVDPVFSSGMLIGLQSAEALVPALRKGTPRALRRYERNVLRQLAVWQRVVGYYYDGSLLTLFRVGEYVRGTLLGRLLDGHFRKHMPRIFTGENTTNPYSLGLVDFMVRHGLAGNDPRELEVR